MDFTQLALRRAGVQSLQEFQRKNGLNPTGRQDALTMQRLRPYLLGYERHLLRRGDSFFNLARRFSTTVEAIAVANPNIDARRLPIGEYLNIPLPFSVVPTDVPFTSALLELCIRGLTVRYPFLTSRRIATTAYGRPISLLQMGTGSRSVLYNASHHANEWITTPLLMKFTEELAHAAAFGERIYTMDAATLLQQTQLYLVPMVNPDGVDLVTGGIEPGSLEYEAAQEIAAFFPEIPFPDGWKANLLGVDLNLNYPAGWEQARENKFALGYDRPAPRDYVGQAPLDQAEALAMVRLTEEVSPRLTLSYHSQGEVIYWRFSDYNPPSSRAIGEIFARSSGYLLEDTPFASGFAGYKDWFIQEYNRPGYTIEVGQGTNPLPLTQFDKIYENNLGILTLGLQL